MAGNVLTVPPGDANQPQRIIFAPTETFLPVGFDDNDNAQAVIYGEYPNTCYRVGPVQASINETRREIRIVNEAYSYPGGWCTDVPVPFTIPVDFGILSQGSYRVVVQTNSNETRAAGTLNISKNRSPNPSNPDDYLYAPVQDAIVDTQTTNAASLTLRGTFKSTCWSIEEIRLIRHPENHVIVVLPIVHAATKDCRDARVPFEVKTSLGTLPKGRTLLHVRSLNGGSLNQVLD